MKISRKITFTTILVVFLLLLLVTPAMADPKSLVCNGADDCRINVLLGPDEYQAGEPFFVIHNAYISVDEYGPVMTGHMGFALELDGVYVDPSWKFQGGFSARGYPPNAVFSGSAFNFPEGLPAGTHTLTGHWYAGCLPADDLCDTPVKAQDFYTEVRVVEFLE